ncbi:Maleylacetate reductase [Cupriavidus taiwanensis]|uniref:maleylacetate reductase n=1 Tax=Cupriavidus taiwanensis TaxID=164546 RepID=UPI000E17CD0B|nr:maleylacetate reductase [Cupriavidus taiwanensis]SOZ15147.1 Maleylacetate reductase [Cupriavidus taiwanensis]SOZ27227.1 Maleylacetate reductase [Cupriavidus taiwanensis]SOZ45719.1 Maleylacetate reductase [Cupriavidus taiwanensis]
MQPFIHETRQSRIVFGHGAREHLLREVEQLGLRRVLVLTSPEQVALGRQMAELIGDRSAGVYSHAVMHVPVDVVKNAVDAVRRAGAEGCVAAGGGSTMGLAKAIALEAGLPFIAVPTTYAGSEMTPLYAITEGGLKHTGRDWRVAPRTVIYDPELTLSLPPGLAMTSGMNAIAHAAEGLYAGDGNPVYALMAEEGIRALAGALRCLQRNACNAEARGDALYGAWLCGMVLGNLQMGIHHKLCHTLGGSFNLPHAEVHTVVLPYAMAYNAEAAPQAMVRIARALGTASAPEGLRELGAALGVPRSLREIGMPAHGLDHAADLVVAAPYPNPRPLERAAVRDLLQRAYEGAAPA